MKEGVDILILGCLRGVFDKSSEMAHIPFNLLEAFLIETPELEWQGSNGAGCTPHKAAEKAIAPVTSRTALCKGLCHPAHPRRSAIS